MGFSITAVPKDYRKHVRSALVQGWSAARDGRGHIRLTKPGSRPIVVPSSPSDYRGKKNCEAEMRRQGILLTA